MKTAWATPFSRLALACSTQQAGRGTSFIGPGLARVERHWRLPALQPRHLNNGQGIGYFVTSMVCQVVFGVLASMIVAWFSRYREFRADAGAASYMGQLNSMISAPATLGRVEPGELPKSIHAAGISDKPSVMALFSTHPPIEARITALQQLRQ